MPTKICISFNISFWQGRQNCFEIKYVKLDFGTVYHDNESVPWLLVFRSPPNPELTESTKAESFIWWNKIQNETLPLFLLEMPQAKNAYIEVTIESSLFLGRHQVLSWQESMLISIIFVAWKWKRVPWLLVFRSSTRPALSWQSPSGRSAHSSERVVTELRNCKTCKCDYKYRFLQMCYCKYDCKFKFVQT